LSGLRRLRLQCWCIARLLDPDHDRGCFGIGIAGWID